jgi:hypothetical protein
MFTPYQQSVNMSWPRPFVVGFILLMVFLSMSGDGPSNLTTDDLSTDSAAKASGRPSTLEKENDLAKRGVKEQIIYDLSLSNEKLEEEIKKFRQYVLDLRRAVRSQPGCSLEDSSILTLYPELHDDIDNEKEDDDLVKERENYTEVFSKVPAKAAAAAVAVEKEGEQQVDSNTNAGSSKNIDSASIRLQNGRLSKDKENSTVSTRTNLP